MREKYTFHYIFFSPSHKSLFFSFIYYKVILYRLHRDEHWRISPKGHLSPGDLLGSHHCSLFAHLANTLLC